MNEIAATLISTVVSTVVASIVAWRVGVSQNKTNQRCAIDELVVKLIELSIEYPYLENDAYCGGWLGSPDADDNKMRYDNYCCLVFNTIELTWRHHGGDRHKIRDMLNVDELIWRHRKWWQTEKNNRKGYPIGVRNFIDSTIERLTSEEGTADQ